mmetsp:Transcript_79030/g.189838  ORF Transcript_79030/g.189838 Transcript_79030/m.189838 type:complete len:249 (+) Transcript_79030:335-1081(+)
MVQQVVALAQDGVLEVQHGMCQHRQGPKGHRIHQETIAKQGIDGEQALAHVEQTLGDSDHEQRVRVLRVVSCQLPQQACESRVVGAGTYQAHAHDRPCGHVLVCIVGQFGQSVDHQHLGIGQVQNRQRQRHGPPQSDLSVLKDVVDGPASHFGTTLLAEGDQGDAQHRRSLVEGLRFLQVIGAGLQHLLHVQHIPAVRERQAFHGELGVLPHGVGDGIQSAQRGLRGILLSQVEQTQSHCEEVGPCAA